MYSILIIEDDNIVLNNILNFLTMKGYVAKGCSSGFKALEIIQEFHPDLIISDINMPEMNGLELLSELQKNSATAKIPFIFLTARVEQQDVRNGMNLGADDYITKPFKFTDLLTAIEMRLKKQNQCRVELEEMKSNISLYVPHELRTPLVSIMGYTDLLLDELDDLSKDEIRDMLLDIKNSNSRLHKLIEKFLLYTQLNLDRASNRLDDEPLSSKYNSFKELLVNEILSLTEAAARFDDFKIEIESEPPDIHLKHLKFMISELIENSIKFSDKGTPIEITTKNDGGFSLIVKDYGRGMTPDQIKNISLFRQFNRDVYQQAGNGLGIITTKKILKIYEGKLNIRSEKDAFTEVAIFIPQN